MAIDAAAPALARLTPAASPSPDRSAPSGGATFGESLAGLLSSVDATAAEANTAIANMIRGTGDVHDAMIALHRAETALQLTVQVRNKLVQAYQDVMRMPI
jgi:flagellar hook-basal body complex protein FliE